MKSKKNKKNAVNKDVKKDVKVAVVKKEDMFEDRLHKHYDELKWLYCELYQQQPNPLNYFDDLIKNLKDFYDQREAYLKDDVFLNGRFCDVILMACICDDDSTT